MIIYQEPHNPAFTGLAFGFGQRRDLLSLVIMTATLGAKTQAVYYFVRRNFRSYERRESDETANLYRIGVLCNVGSPGDDTRLDAGLTVQ